MQSDQQQSEPLPEINTVDVYLVLTLALGENPPPSFILDTRIHPLTRGPYDVYVLQYPDGTRYAVQVPIRMHGSPRSEIQELIENEAANLEELAEAKFPYSPRLVTCSATYRNYLRFPYIIMTFIEGRPLEWVDSAPNFSVRQWVLIQLAEIVYELTMCTLQHEPETHAEDFLMDKVDNKIFQVIRKQRDDLSLQDGLWLRFILRQIGTIPNPLYPNNDTGPHVSKKESDATATALAHDNLCASNILIDDRYNIKGLINWSITKRLPLRFALKLPRLLTIQPNPHDTSIEHFMEIVDQAASPLESLTWSRTVYAQSLCLVIWDRAPDSVLTRSGPLCMDRTDLDWKHWMLTSALSTSFDKWMRENGYMLFRTELGGHLVESQKTRNERLKEELVDFCERHLLDYATSARKKTAMEVIAGLFTGSKNWKWAEQWMALQFGKRPG